MRLSHNSETCSGCKACQLVCALQNLKEINPAKAALNVRGRFPAPGRYYADLCTQCGECAKACPAEAIALKAGAYRISRKNCDRCLACVDSCPAGLIKVTEEGYPYKCINCRQCVEICPRDALALA